MNRVSMARYLLPLFDRLRQVVGRNRLVFNLTKLMYFSLLARFVDKKSHIKKRFAHRLKQLSSFMVRNGMVGGCLTEEGEFYIKTYDGIYLYYNFSNDRYTLGDGQSLEFRSAQQSNPIETFLMNYLRDGMVYFDVGASNGYYYSLKIAKRFPKCRIYAFEPDTKILPHLKRNIKYNGFKIRVIPNALTDHVCTAKLTANLGASNYVVVDRRDSSPAIEIKCTTLDSFVAKNSINQIDLIKVDIEGAEHNFIKGAQRSIEKFKPVMILELNDELLKRNNSSRSHVVSFLKRLNFRCFQVMGSNDALVLPVGKISAMNVVDERWLHEILMV